MIVKAPETETSSDVEETEPLVGGGRGRVTRESTYWCGLCGNWDQQPFRWRLDKVMKANGWRMTRANGWLCPKCAKKQAEK
jgi:hypothetical protein